jgi:hypothetical protein
MARLEKAILEKHGIVRRADAAAQKLEVEAKVKAEVKVKAEAEGRAAK